MSRRMILISFLSLTALHTVALWLDSSVPAADSIFGPLKELTLVGALVAAVAQLWKTNGKKDEIILNAAKTTTDALAQSASTSQELRKIIDKQVEVNESTILAFKELIGALKNVKCLVDPLKEKSSYVQVEERTKSSGGY